MEMDQELQEKLVNMVEHSPYTALEIAYREGRAAGIEMMRILHKKETNYESKN